MQMLLQDCSSLSTYIEQSGKKIYVSDDLDGRKFHLGTILSIYKAMEESQVLWGRKADYFIQLSNSRPAEDRPFMQRFKEINLGESEDTIIIGYADGGLIIISRDNIPLLDRAVDASWWYPT